MKIKRDALWKSVSAVTVRAERQQDGVQYIREAAVG
jgi:hypothetical protein